MMALPPTALKDILCGTPEEMVRTLVREGCLSPAGLADEEAVTALIEDAIRKCEAFYAEHPDWCGPTGIDRVADALVASEYLSERGRKLQSADTR